MNTEIAISTDGKVRVTHKNFWYSVQQWCGYRWVSITKTRDRSFAIKTLESYSVD